MKKIYLLAIFLLLTLTALTNLSSPSSVSAAACQNPTTVYSYSVADCADDGFGGSYCIDGISTSATVGCSYTQRGLTGCFHDGYGNDIHSYCTNHTSSCIQTIRYNFVIQDSSGCFVDYGDGGGGGGGGADPTPVPDAPTPTPKSDLTVTQVSAHSSTGSKPTYFKTGEQIFTETVISNLGPRQFPAFTSRVTPFDGGDQVSSIATTAPMNSGTSHTYQSWSGGSNNSAFTPKSFQQTWAGSYKIGVRANVGANPIPETSTSNNFKSDDYEVRATVNGYACNDKNENGRCGDSVDRAKGDLGISLDQDKAPGNGFETHIKTISSEPNGQVDFDYRPGGHYKMFLADTDSNNQWGVIGSRNNGDGTDVGAESCIYDLGQNWTCTLAVAPLHTVSGRIFIDEDRDGNLDSGENSGLGNMTIKLTGGDQQTTKTSTNGSYTFKGLRGGHVYKVEITSLPDNYVAYPSNIVNVSPAIAIGQSGPQTYTTNIGVNVSQTLTGRVYVDSDKNGSYDPDKDFPIANRTVSVGGKMDLTATTGSDGKYTISGLVPGNYSVDVSQPNGYVSLTTPLPRLFIVEDGENPPAQNIRLFGAYTINGNVFVDENKDKIKNGGETNLSKNPNVNIYNISGRPKAYRVNNNDGTYSMKNLINANYTVRYAGLPSGYLMSHPVNTTPPSFSVTVGSGCAQGTPNPGGNCNGQSLENLNFAVSQGAAWIQGPGVDIRFDHGIYNPVPLNPAPSCGGANTLVGGSSATPGIAYSGDTTADFGQGAASSTNWIVGNSTYPEQYTARNEAGTETSYDYLQSVVKQANITVKNLASVCALTGCTLPTNLPAGVYQADGDVVLDASVLNGNRDYVFLINGTLRINGTVDVSYVATATFSVSGNITIDPGVGRAPACPVPASGQIEGFYSTDDSFIVESNADCSIDRPDLQLNMQGSIVVNGDRNSGVFQNKRTLCSADDLLYPSFTIKDRPDLILNTPDFMRVPTYIWQEVAPK